MASNSSDGEQTFRMRFYNFNMANSNTFEGLHQLQGALGRSLEDWIQEPFPDGQSCDAVFVTLTETRLHLGPWVREYRSHSNSKLDCATYQNSVKEADKTNDMPWSGMLDGMAEKYNGNLKTLLLFLDGRFSRSRFRGDPEMSPLFGRLTDKRLAGVALPNPKKAFMGRSLLSRQGPLHVCFAGAHFPIAEVAAALDDSQNPLETSKVIMARILRRVLRNASYHGLLSENTLLLLQGDLNSRTVLVDGVKDILKEVMADTKLQAAIRHSLPVPEGEWFEPSGRTSALNLPVTYKFSSEVGTAFKQADSSLSLEEVLAATPCRPSDGAYAATLQSVPPDVLKGWSLDFKEANFRNFRFPAAADRLICWAPKDLARRLQWSFPQGGYEVNHKQGGSDHRPVRLEVQLTLQPSREEPVKGEELELPPDLLQAVAEDEEGDGGESPGLLNSLASAAGTAKFSFGNWFSRQPDGYSLK